MHTARVASRAASVSRSAYDTAATDSMPSCSHARTMRTAISPRLAMNRRSITGIRTAALVGRNYDHHLIEFDHAFILGQDPGHDAADSGLDRVEQLHDFDETHGILRTDAL